MLKKFLKAFFLEKAKQRKKDAEFWHTHYPPGTFGFEKGNISMAISNLYKALADSVDQRSQQC